MRATIAWMESHKAVAITIVGVLIAVVATAATTLNA
jgi:hypothetical protein